MHCVQLDFDFDKYKIIKIIKKLSVFFKLKDFISDKTTVSHSIFFFSKKIVTRSMLVFHFQY